MIAGRVDGRVHSAFTGQEKLASDLKRQAVRGELSVYKSNFPEGGTLDRQAFGSQRMLALSYGANGW